MKIGFHGLLVVLALTFVGCATTPTIKEMEKEIVGFELPKGPSDGKAIVYIVRPSSLGMLIGFDVYVDEKKVDYLVGTTHGSQYIYFDIEPGVHTILSQAENMAEYKFTSTAGGVYYFEQTPTMGILYARNELGVTMDTTGKYWVKKLKLGTLKK